MENYFQIKIHYTNCLMQTVLRVLREFEQQDPFICAMFYQQRKVAGKSRTFSDPSTRGEHRERTTNLF